MMYNEPEVTAPADHFAHANGDNMPVGSVMFFLDVTVLVYNEHVAHEFGRDGNQIAIFDLQRGVEMDTGGTGLPIPGTPLPRTRLQLVEERDRVEFSEGVRHDHE